MEYKILAVKPAKEIGGAKEATELGIPENTMYAWTKAAREGRLDIGSGSYTLQTAMNLAGGLAVLRRQVKEQEKEIRRLKEENGFLGEAGSFIETTRKHPYSQREDGLPRHGENRIQPPPETQTKRNYQSGS